MRGLGFYDDKQSSRALLSQAWTHLQAEAKDEVEQDTSGTVGVDDVKVFLAAVLNFNQPWMKSQEEEEEQRPRVNPKKLGSFKEGKYVVSEEEISVITKHFVLLHASR